MPRYAQLVMGPAGSGKSTYCDLLVKAGEALKRSFRVINLDPAAEHFAYPVFADVRELIALEDAMEDEEMHLGPNGGLVFCMEYLVKHLDWLTSALGENDDEDYVLIDCPGQIELYTHLPVMHAICEHLSERLHYRVCAVFLLDAQFLTDASKLISGLLAALSVMVRIEVPHVNVLTKLDLLSKHEQRRLDELLEPNLRELLARSASRDRSHFARRYRRLTRTLADLVDEYSLIKLLPLDARHEESINDLLLEIDLVLQLGDERDARERDFDDTETTLRGGLLADNEAEAMLQGDFTAQRHSNDD